jgi:hypothetical protein
MYRRKFNNAAKAKRNAENRAEKKVQNNEESM